MGKKVEEENISAAKHLSRRLSVEEFLIDFFGGLVPGTLFIIAMLIALLPALHALLAALSYDEANTLSCFIVKFLKAISGTPTPIWIGFFFIGILFAFVLGHLFYRYDPQKADKASFKRLIRKMKNKTDNEKKEDLGCDSEENCRFPYPDYALYLEKRGLTHLLPFIAWKNNGSNHTVSKTYINLLKVRLRYYHPDKCGAIIRNEAHVRLASSTWRVSELLINICIFSLIICFLAIFITVFNSPFYGNYLQTTIWFLPDLILPLIVLFFSIFIEWEINGFFHYQRLREVYFVFETAYTAFQENPKLLDPPFKIL